MEQKIFSKSNERLIRVFLEEEAKQYPHKFCKNFNQLWEENKYSMELLYMNLELNDEGKNWVNQVFSKIIDGITKLSPVGSNKYIIRSLGNTGCVISELSIDGQGDYSNWKNGNCFITLCTCGQLNHWGFVSRNNPGGIVDLTERK